MTPEQLTEQTIAAFAAWRKDQNTQIEGSNDQGKTWEKPVQPSWNPLWDYRIAPFTLGNSINGHTLGEGEQWHRLDGWKPEWLTGSTRPYLKGETLLRGDDLRYAGGFSDTVKDMAGYKPAEFSRCWFMTTRPLPSAQLAPGRNGFNKLTVAQVGKGFRLLDLNEGTDKRHSKEWWQSVEFWYSLRQAWENPHGGEGTIWRKDTLRTRLTREELAALDVPKPKFRPFTFEEVPITPKVKRKSDGKTFAAKHSASTPRFVVDSEYYDYAGMFERFTFLDGTPFGMEVK